MELPHETEDWGYFPMYRSMRAYISDFFPKDEEEYDLLCSQ
jgi:hypothetical protein